MFDAADMRHMQQALALAEKGLWTTTPNPRVGCVLVREGQVVGEGWHAKAGGPHAEVVALQQAADRARGATAFITLEPCAHIGRTGPCTEALIRAGVAMVVVATEDPNPRVSGRGLARLREAGLGVRVGLLSEQAQALNAGFFKRMRTGL
ncbi:MAG TPA: bifunctional diaminohydroxyphosphoribosylaminopyrimidine deaminase/5-amino-6-(5-phosphoribosylamino)uracil reductase RibD, partial [Burkholderiaceae bacterium]|nr:bifunctional diaminohydroxyphosphoribosylaminopyrimidine deaminase/5-amino-6-(5-phosphoribosylamino)uracil reductase RibD [Burkholderiaceae bacterium]